MRESDPGVVLGLHRSRYERHLLTGALDLGIRAIDTSFNYLGFRAHEVLAKVAGDVLGQFRLATKVGYFPAAGRSAHSLAPGRLRTAIEQTNRDLGRTPDLVFLHNPEDSLHGEPAHARETLANACNALQEATAEGLCRAWGVASWKPSLLLTTVDLTAPRPSVLMTRAGLLVGSETLDASDALAGIWGIRDANRWGMSPFGGNATDQVWTEFDPRIFLEEPPNQLSRLQAAFRAAYSLPKVSTVAVGSDNLAHLRELLEALRYEVDTDKVLDYRGLLRGRGVAT
ncbi:aldo/keto reductase [Streptomyces sp. NPDC051218]|uniref:aldo/keto reductase n=1 Tax=Streptomyces sp. NPDC051218 TaxID=3365645 RepID=UPI0037B22226